ncbi:HAMP domain-containing histidine kinase [Micromonospora sp. NBC_01740]|uniref:sensor histidine kinase n=1 Tax=Micromonospora sp. NBC_01740 TaxID=2975986 RepID=UPI003FA3D672|nr:HAMP domain-containing histidine kinase [Micromonospora sp. NBC_01740]
MVVGVLGVSGGLAVGGLVLLAVLGWALQRAVDTEAFQTADAVALLAAEEVLPDPLPVAGGQVRVQVIDAEGRVRAASIDADRLVPMVSPERIDAGARQRLTVSGERVGLAGPVRVVTVPAGTAADPRTVLVARSLADVRHSAHVVRTILLVSFPLLVAVLAAVAWRVVGATLRPVEALRRGAEEITGRDGGGRLPVPASQDEIHRLAVTLNGMLGRLESARDRQRAFVADAAHELRSPLTNIRTELEVARRLADRTDWTEVSANLLADTERLGRLVDDLLLLARLDERPTARATGPVELGALLAAVAARYPSPPVRLDAPAMPLWTEGDPDELRRILTNLVDNAVRHAHGEVVLTAGPGIDEAGGAGGTAGRGAVDGGLPSRGAPDGWTAGRGAVDGGTAGRGAADGGAAGRGTGGSGAGDGAYHLVTVTDDGPGIPAADRERVFGRFTRLDDARARDDGGAGLGLAIVRELVRRAGGGIVLTDAHPGRDGGPGLRVRLLLPALPDPERP